MEINLSKDSVVNKRTGQVDTPSEYLMNLRAIEDAIATADDEIASLRSALKHQKDKRDELVAQLRAGIRNGEVLPLLEVDDEDEVDGLDVAADDGLDSDDD